MPGVFNVAEVGSEPFLCNRRPGQIPAQSLHTVAIAAVAIDHRARVDLAQSTRGDVASSRPPSR
jgi:hypothetical protein